MCTAPGRTLKADYKGACGRVCGRTCGRRGREEAGVYAGLREPSRGRRSHYEKYETTEYIMENMRNEGTGSNLGNNGGGSRVIEHLQREGGLGTKLTKITTQSSFV